MSSAASIVARIRTVVGSWWSHLPFVRSSLERRTRVPTILQMEAVECGAASLAMVLAAFGRLEPLEELRVACGVSRDGSKASNLLKAARTFGITAKGFRKHPKQLREMPTPMILHWNFNHFLVLEGFGRGNAYINDPAYGPKRITLEELDTAFTGVALTFEPGPDFERKGKKRGILSALLPRLRGSYVGLLYVVLAGFALLVPGLVIPTFSQVFIDDILVSGLTRWLRPLLIFMGIAATLQMILTWLQQRYLLRLETKLSLSTSSKFLWHVLRLPVEFFNQRYAGDISSRVGINDKLAMLVSGEMATTLLNVVVIVFYAALMLQYDVVLTVVSVLIAALNLFVLQLVSRRRTDLNQRLQQDQGKLMGIAMGGLQTVETLKANGSEGDFFGRFAGYYAKVINSGQQFAVTTHLLVTVPPLLLSINMAVLLGLGGHRVMDGHLSMGMLMAFQALMLTFIAPVNSLVNLGGTLQEVEGDLNRVDDVLLAQPTTVELGEPAGLDITDSEESEAADGALAQLNGFLELRDVAFGYSRLEAPLIEGFNLRLRPGSRVALVGGSGSGKSTIAKLVAGLYDVWDGEILLDDRPRSMIPSRILAQSLALVDQDPFLFEATIRENLAMWDDTISEVDLVRAAKDAAIHDDLTTRPKGYESLVAEGGRNFSGGQRQRLEIARALAGNPAILILDEATSALDPTTEKIIDDNLRRRGVTCLMVAHRLSTIRDCDEIVVMERGKIVERGTHEELIAENGTYTRLIAAG